MVEVTYYCPHCGALTTLERDAYMADRSVTKRPLEGYEYAPTTGDYGDADGVELVCLGDGDRQAADASTPGKLASAERVPGPDPTADGCGRTFYLNFVAYEDGEPVADDGRWLEDEPNFEFLR